MQPRLTPEWWKFSFTINMANKTVSYHIVSTEPAPGLRNSVAAGLQDAECTLVTHANQTTQRQLQHHAPLERHKVTHVLQQKELGPVEVTVAQIARDQRVL